MRSVIAVVLIVMFFLAGVGIAALTGNEEEPNITLEQTLMIRQGQEVQLMPPPNCVITYGPIPLNPASADREGWTAWGVVCSPGHEPLGSQ